MLIHNLNFELYIPADIISHNIERVAKEINSDFAEAEKPPLLMVTLGGAIIFAADLCRKLNFMSELSYVKCSSYNNSLYSSGSIIFELEPTISPQGRDVIVLEDIVDTGNTYEVLYKYLMDNGAKSVRIATMLIKRDIYKKDLPIDYVAAESENIFVIGMGLDYNQLGRNLDGIYRLSQ